MLQRLRKVYSNLDISASQIDGPTKGRPDIAAVKEATTTPQETKAREGDIVLVEQDSLCIL